MGAPSIEAHRVAKFTRIVGAKVLGLGREIALRWYREPEARSKGRVMNFDDSTVWVRQRDAEPEDLVGVVLHELQHLADHAVLYSLGHETRERRARDFAAKWTEAVFRGGQAVEWDPSRVTLIDERHPSFVWPALEAKRGDVVISRTGRAWEKARDCWMQLLV